ncbi:WD40-repeat-containing domain protein [Spinellus fusiger]|nr:WD40-repeat-containing domain protein [Spinellus fusiger]
MENRRGFIIRTGGSIFGLDFVPKRPSVDSEPSVAYLAVGGYRGAHEEHHTLNEIQSGYQNALQIWRYGQTTGLDTEKPSLAMCILHDYGVVYELKWCPYGAYEEVSSVQGTWPKLGILAAAFGDGTVRLLVVPHPKAIQKGQETVYLRVEAVRSTFAYPRINCRSIAWGGHSFLAMGSTSGSIMVQNAMLSLVGSPSVRRNTMIYHSNQHEGSVESIAWYGSLESCFFASTGRDGRTLVHDLRDVSTIGEVCRVTGTRHAVAWKPTMGVFFLSNDNSVQHASVSFDPIQSITKLTKHIGHSSQVWSISTSEFHDCIASGSTDGYFNIMDPTLTRMKTRTQLHRIMYKLVWNEATSTLRYIDGKYVFSPVQDANVWGYASHPILSVQRVSLCIIIGMDLPNAFLR